MSGGGHSTEWRQYPATTKGRIFTVARELFASHGYERTTLRDIATGVGIEAPSLYNHVDSKESLLFTLVCDATQDIIEHLEGSLAAAEPDPESQVRAAVHSDVRYHCYNRQTTAVGRSGLSYILSSERFTEARRRRADYEGMFKAIVGSGIGAGVIRAGDVTVLTNALLALGAGIQTWFRLDGPMSADAVAELYADIAVRGLCSQASEANRRPQARARAR